MSTFIRATNTGVGFITREDRLGFTLAGVATDIYEVSGDYQEWVTRVSGVEVSESEALAIIEAERVAAEALIDESLI